MDGCGDITSLLAVTDDPELFCTVAESLYLVDTGTNTSSNNNRISR